MSSHLINETTNGVYIISATPFDDAGNVDKKSVDSLTDFYLDAGVDGLTILGVLGEATKLTNEERREVMAQMLKRVDGRKKVIVGASDPGTDNMIRFAKESMDLGAAGVMIAPIPGLKTDAQVYNYWAHVLKQLGPDVPVCYQDYPQTTTVFTAMSVLLKLIEEFPNFVMLKHEEGSGLNKVTQLRDQSAAKGLRRISVLVGNGGLYLPQELRRGVDGAMTGFAYPEMLVEVCQKFHAGQVEEAEDVFDLYLPVLRHEQQLGFGLAVRKEILRRRGAIASSRVRHPGPVLNDADHKELDSLLARLERCLAARKG